jgi:hypothetical protein
MRHPVRSVEAISSVETIDNLDYTGRTEYRQRSRSTGNPGIEIEFWNSSDVVGVKVSEEDRLQTFQRQATECCDLGRAGTGVNHVQRFSGQNRDTGLGTVWRRKRGGCATHEYLEAVELTHRRWLLHCYGYSLLEKPVLTRAGVPNSDADRYNENANTSHKLEKGLDDRTPIVSRFLVIDLG